MEMKDRIKKIRRDAELTQQKFADRIGLKQNTIALIESGKRNTSDQSIFAICREFDVNEEWLRDGIGEPYIQKTRTDEIADFVNRIQTDDNPFKARLIQMLSKMTEDEWELLEKMIDRMTKEQEETGDVRNSDVSPDTVEAAEAAYIKSRSGSAQKTARFVSNTTEGNANNAVG